MAIQGMRAEPTDISLRHGICEESACVISGDTLIQHRRATMLCKTYQGAEVGVEAKQRADPGRGVNTELKADALSAELTAGPGTELLGRVCRTKCR